MSSESYKTAKLTIQQKAQHRQQVIPIIQAKWLETCGIDLLTDECRFVTIGAYQSTDESEEGETIVDEDTDEDTEKQSDDSADEDA